MLSEISQTQKDKYYDISYMWTLKKQTNLKKQKVEWWLLRRHLGMGKWELCCLRYTLATSI